MTRLGAPGLGVRAIRCDACGRTLAPVARYGFPGGMKQIRFALLALMAALLSGPAFAAAKPIPIKVLWSPPEASGPRITWPLVFFQVVVCSLPHCQAL